MNCFLGLIDFGVKNTKINILIFFLGILIILTLLFLKKEKKYSYYYLLALISINIPLFDFYHFMFFWIAFLLIVFMNQILTKKIFEISGKIFYLFIVIFFINQLLMKQGTYPNNLPHMEYRFLTNKEIHNTMMVNQLIKKYYNKVIIVGPQAYYHKIILNQKITDLDLINNGNWGFHGNQRIIQKLRSLDEEYVIFIDRKEQKQNTQTPKEVIDFVTKNGIQLEQTDYYDIYQLKKEKE